MDTTTSVVATGLLTTLGQWSEDKGLSLRIIIGVAFLAVSLSMLSSVNDKLARGIALLVLVTAVFRYFPSIAKKIK